MTRGARGLLVALALAALPGCALFGEAPVPPPGITPLALPDLARLDALGPEQITSREDAAGAATVYLRAFERTRDPRHRARARAFLDVAVGQARTGVLGDPDLLPGLLTGVLPETGTSIFDALASASDERRAAFAGLAYAWLREETRDANAPTSPHATIQGLLALQAVTADPVAAELAHYRPLGKPTPPGTPPPASRTFESPLGDRVILHADGRLERTAPPVELTYWPAANPAEMTLATELVERWNREHPDVHVRLQPLPAGRSSEEVLLAAIVARSTPDLCSNVSSALLARLVRAGGVVRLDTLAPTAARLTERATDEMLRPLRLPDGGVYAFPWKVNPVQLLYNVDQLAAAGVTPPRTHRELLTALRALAADRDGDGRRDHWGLSVSIETTWYRRFLDFYPLYLAGSGGHTLVEHGKVVFDSDAARAAVGVLAQAFAEDLVPLAVIREGNDPFFDGTVSMKMVGPYFIQEIELLKTRALRYAAAPVPVPDGVDPATARAFGDFKSIAVFTTTRHPEEAARFLAYLTSAAADRRLIELTAQLPFRRGLASDPRFAEALAGWPALVGYAAAVENLLDLDVDADVVEIFDLISEAYEAGAIYRIKSPARAISDAAAEAQRLVDAP